MRNDDQQHAAADEQRVAGARAMAAEPDRSPAPTPLLILASTDDLVCVDALCPPAAGAENAATSRPENDAETAAETGAGTRRATDAESHPRTAARTGAGTGAGT